MTIEEKILELEVAFKTAKANANTAYDNLRAAKIVKAERDLSDAGVMIGDLVLFADGTKGVVSAISSHGDVMFKKAKKDGTASMMSLHFYGKVPSFVKVSS